MQAIAGMMAAWELWERALIPSLLSGAGTWFGLKESKKAVELCDSLQNYFWRVMLTVPESCPRIALRCETAMMGMKWRIWLEKLMLLRRIKSQETTSLCRQIYDESRVNGWPGLGQEVSEICQEIGLPDINIVTVPKTVVKRAIWEHHQLDIRKELHASKKLEDIKDEDFSEVQDYFKDKSVGNTRMAFKIRCKMVPDIPGNFKQKYKKKGTDGLLCSYCGEGKEMSQNHCLDCSAWTELRKGLDLTNISDLVAFFRKLLEERARLETEGVLNRTASHDSCPGD
jgi:hypothetical protein